MDFGSLATWFSDAIGGWFHGFLNLCIDLINTSLRGLVDFIISVCSTLFPAAGCCGSLSVPIPPAGPVYDSLVHTLNWLFPMGTFIDLVGCIMTLMTAFFAVAPVARWLKLLN